MKKDIQTTGNILYCLLKRVYLILNKIDKLTVFISFLLATKINQLENLNRIFDKQYDKQEFIRHRNYMNRYIFLYE